MESQNKGWLLNSEEDLLGTNNVARAVKKIQAWKGKDLKRAGTCFKKGREQKKTPIAS